VQKEDNVCGSEGKGKFKGERRYNDQMDCRNEFPCHAGIFRKKGGRWIGNYLKKVGIGKGAGGKRAQLKGGGNLPAKSLTLVETRDRRKHWESRGRGRGKTPHFLTIDRDSLRRGMV